jgi:uncharacterized protein
LSTLADRVRGIVRQSETPASLPAAPERSASGNGSRDLAALDGRPCEGGCVIDRRLEPLVRYSRQTIGQLADGVTHSAAAASLFAADASPPFVFVDLETTGLNGGAGTHVFLTGCGWFTADGAFVTRQFLLTNFAEEPRLLRAVAGELGRAGALVSFNGKSFDAPLLETRFLFHRLEWPLAGRPHVDVLHAARRFWRPDDGSIVKAIENAGCSLSALESRLLGTLRKNDVSGFEVPARYFQFVRSGDAAPLVPVLEHNRLDLLALAALTARLLHLSRAGPDAARSAGEALALGRMYMRAGFEDRAREALARSIELSRAPAGAFDPVRIDAMLALALALRRARRFDEAAQWWQHLIDTHGCPSQIRREAIEALAIHNEHRVHDLITAQTFALQNLDGENHPGRTRAVQHRLARLDRKLRQNGNLEFGIRNLEFEFGSG